MSLFDSLMRQGGAPAMMSVFGKETPATYKPPKGESFDWKIIAGKQTGGDAYDEQTGDRIKVIRFPIKGPADILLARGISTIQKNAQLVIDGVCWGVEPTTSKFGAVFVELGLMLKFTTSHEDLASHGPVR